MCFKVSTISCSTFKFFTTSAFLQSCALKNSSNWLLFSVTARSVNSLAGCCAISVLNVLGAGTESTGCGESTGW